MNPEEAMMMGLNTLGRPNSEPECEEIAKCLQNFFNRIFILFQSFFKLF